MTQVSLGALDSADFGVTVICIFDIMFHVESDLVSESLLVSKHMGAGGREPVSNLTSLVCL